MAPSGVTWRMRLLPVSEMKMSPLSSAATPCGVFRLADVAAPSSPLDPATPVPATVVMIPLTSTLRMR